MYFMDARNFLLLQLFLETKLGLKQTHRMFEF